jgi:cellulose synthase operon protein C
MHPSLAFSCRVFFLAALTGLALAGGSAQAQLTPDQQADMLLNSARKAYNEKNYPFASAKFREFIAKFGGHKHAPAARYGLALVLVEGFDKNYAEARDLLQPLVGNKDFPDRPFALYYLGLAQRGLGLHELQLAVGKAAPEVQQRRNVAAQRFGDAAGFFSQALGAFSERAKTDAQPKNAKELSPNAEWAARARCDLAEALLRQGKYKEAQAAAAPFARDASLARSQCHGQGLYWHGYASLLNKDLMQAEKSLSLLAPFTAPIYGNHARYLLARAHHAADDRTEATAHYEGVIGDYTRARLEAGKIAQVEAKRMQTDPVFRAEMEALMKGPTPDHIARAQFYLGVLQYEGGKFADARVRLAEFLKQNPQSPLRTEAELRVGFCQVQMKEYADAVKTLTPLVERDPRLSDQVLFWLGKAQAGLAPAASANLKGHETAIQAAINTLRQAADRAQRIQDQDPEARSRRAEIMLEIADQLQHIRQHRESANLYNQILNEKLLSGRAEETMQRYAVALHLAGDYTESDKVCARFRTTYPLSSLTPAVLFCAAENSFFRIVAADKNPNQAERAKQLPPLFDETIKRFAAIVEKYPEYAKINLARYSLGLTYYRKGDLDTARKILSDIPQADRVGEIGLASYLMADCILRQVPATVPEDALAAGKMEEQLKSSADLLDGFIGANPKDDNVADALIKLGLCQQRLAALTSQAPERAKMLAVARATYEKLFHPEFKGIPQVAQATFERAKVMALANDVNGAINELRRFTNDPLKQYTQVAPMALIQLATYLRATNRAPEAADVLAKGRAIHEGNLSKDPERASWVGLLRYHQGVALREAGKLPEARALFDMVVKTSPNRPEANESALRLGQCLKDEGQQRLESAAKLRGSGKKEDQAKANQLVVEGVKTLHEAVAFLEGHAEKLKKQETQQDVCARMLYDAAWSARALAGPEVDAARAKLTQEMAQKLKGSSSKFPLPAVPLDKVPMQPAEKKARGLYQALIDGFGESPIATEARFELAELMADRNEHEQAVKLLNDVLDKEPSPELTEKIRLRMGGIQAAKGNLKAALAQFDAVAKNPKSTLAGWALYRAGEALLKDQQTDAAIKRLMIFRDQGPYQNLPGLSDRALLRLGYAYALTKAWEPSRQANERLVGVFPNSPWADEARYSMGWAFQQQKNLEAAVNSYTQVTGRTASELAAKAQLQIGLCRLEQKRYADAVNAFLVIPFTYNYPELTAAARFEASRAYIEQNQKDLARKQLDILLKEMPATPWAEAAKERLESLKVK